MRQALLVIMLLMAVKLAAVTRTVAQDGSGDYTVVQQAINASASGDTVLVHPGTYYENLTINSGITLGSLFLTTGDESYVQQTVLDGNQQGTVTYIHDTSPDTCSVVGVTVTNGYAPRDCGRETGGVEIQRSDVRITGCLIEKNRSTYIGSVFLLDASTLNLSGTTIRYNRGGIGGICFSQSYLFFDETNLCNIYLSYGSTCDIRKSHDTPQSPLIVYADTISVLEHESYDGYFYSSVDLWNTPQDDIIVNANHGKIEPVHADLYVAPDGNDSNSGLTPNDPLQRICYAMTIIASDSLQKHTIHLSDGF